MSFEISDRDLLGRVGKLKTKKGTIETPQFLPVVNLSIQMISPKEIMNDFKCNTLFTNAFITMKNFGKEAINQGIHNLLDFSGVVATDSGAYQILVYGDVETTAEEIAKFQEDINTDIAVILDVPTGWNSTKRMAEWTVKETLRRARETLDKISKKDILWMGPVQGGNHLDLVAYSAKEIGKMSFQIHALGSPTQIMEQYTFDTLVDMIIVAKKNLPIERPFHLFGAGHPFMFAIAVALGCDTFDSAAYAIYARKEKYMTEHGTIKLSDLKYLPCMCRICSSFSLKELKEASSNDKMRLLASHNLYSCITEIRRIKQAINDGRLWELLEIRARSHPSLMQALKKLREYQEIIEISSPLSKDRGIFYVGPTSLARPEIVRHRMLLKERYSPPKEAQILILLPQTKIKPFHRSAGYKKLLNKIFQISSNDLMKIHICTYAVPFGIIPLEINDVFPLSQYESSFPAECESINYVVTQVEKYLTDTKYTFVILHLDRTKLSSQVEDVCKKTCYNLGIKLISSKHDKPWSKKAIIDLQKIISKVLRMKTN